MFKMVKRDIRMSLSLKSLGLENQGSFYLSILLLSMVRSCFLCVFKKT